MTGKLPGLTVWQIENFYPIELDEGIPRLPNVFCGLHRFQECSTHNNYITVVYFKPSEIACVYLFVAQHGQFYKGDCYIVLKVSYSSMQCVYNAALPLCVLQTEWNEMSELTWDIYFWIGDNATVRPS